VGAIVLITPEGDVLAAASEPTQDGLPPTPNRDLERSHARERTLTRPAFNPPGSVFKPFVAAYALDRVGLDPLERFTCVPLDDGGYGYEDSHGRMHCHVGGHGKSNLAEALAVSCNATFAQIGERFESEQLLEMADLFGFGHPTGISHVPAEAGRRGSLREDWELKNLPAISKQLRYEANRMRFANGLTFLEVTPMQVTRATAALVTGKLPELRIAHSVAGMEIAHASSDLPISPRAREIVCQALQGVINDPGGTAHNKGLDRTSLGFSFVCKTGSADTKEIVGIDGAPSERKDGQKKMRKQTWIAGWFPVEAPKAILVVMLHDVIVNSDHSSVYVAAQFLHSPAVRRFVEGASSAPSRTEGGADPAARASDGGGEASGGPPTVRKEVDR
jgi:cell division protein FtsI/penicillin-binding protein 2